MALDNLGSTIPTLNEFLAHWNAVNAALPVDKPLVLPEEKGVIPAGFNISGLVALKTLLVSQLEDLQDKLNDVQIAQGGIDSRKATLYKRLTLFLEVFDGYYARTDFARARPEAPGIGAGEEKFIDPLRDMKSLWAKMNAAAAPAGITVPIILNEGTLEDPINVTLAQFTTLLTELQTKYEARAQAEQDVKLVRGGRDRTVVEVRAVLVAYRAAVLPRISGNKALVDSIPRVTPEPGHTPEPVDAQGVLQGENTAKVSHTQSDDADFKEYQLRGTIGPEGNTDDAILLGTHAARTPADFFTTFGLASPGSAVSLWVYVITRDGNERASNRVVVTRPE